MARKPQYRALAGIDRNALAAFQAGIRKRYTDEQILEELSASAKRLGRSPTMREFAADPETTVHPQTVIEHFGSWNEAKRTAGLVPEHAHGHAADALLQHLLDRPQHAPQRPSQPGSVCGSPRAPVNVPDVSPRDLAGEL